ncbi:MAG: hypothetical protein JNK94_06205 [Hyphomonadaceae bacterium]|nr:hypothetical protein [Hyphomonadaceae bacterium]
MTRPARWTPPPGRVRLSATLYCSAGLSAGGVFEVHIRKNGAAYRGRTGIAPAASGSIDITCLADANGTDYFEAYAYVTTASTATAFGVATYTHFQGEQI